MKKQNKGITLVALVITIIVLIILAAVSINAVMNEGLINNAKESAGKYEQKSAEEQLELAKLEGMLAAETLPIVKAGEYTGTENKRYVEGGKTAIIPAGFTVSNIDSEKTISGGLVIYAGDHSTVTDMTTVQGSANQYVWIPVDNPSDIYGKLDNKAEGIEGNLFGKLYDFGDSTNGYAESPSEATHFNWPTEEGYYATVFDSYREPAYLANSKYADDSEYNTNGTSKIITQNVLIKEFNDMITSVEKYKGFYIGRYEVTGSITTPTVRKGAKPLLSEKSYIVKERLRWYGLYSMCEKLETNDKVKTTMIWGCQWDQAIKMSLTDKSDFLKNAGAYGVFGANISVPNTGTETPVFNIYGMSGQVSENTLEAYQSSTRVTRSGAATSYSAVNPASYRNSSSPKYDAGTHRHACRTQLYIK